MVFYNESQASEDKPCGSKHSFSTSHIKHREGGRYSERDLIRKKISRNLSVKKEEGEEVNPT